MPNERSPSSRFLQESRAPIGDLLDDREASTHESFEYRSYRSRCAEYDGGPATSWRHVGIDPQAAIADLHIALPRAWAASLKRLVQSLAFRRDTGTTRPIASVQLESSVRHESHVEAVPRTNRRHLDSNQMSS